jgi:hypothetical protein
VDPQIRDLLVPKPSNKVILTMEVTVLNKVAEGTFMRQGNQIAPARLSEWTRQPQQFRLAIRCCDGSFSVVNSEIKEVMSIGINRSDIKNAINILAPLDPSQGKRFVIFEANPTGKGYLLGTVEQAVLELSRCNGYSKR